MINAKYEYAFKEAVRVLADVTGQDRNRLEWKFLILEARHYKLQDAKKDISRIFYDHQVKDLLDDRESKIINSAENTKHNST